MSVISKKQMVIAKSSVEAKSQAEAHGCCELCG